ncbi:MAG: hypothetical protein AAF985_24815, partial [Bacteroidota bacterium]
MKTSFSFTLLFILTFCCQLVANTFPIETSFEFSTPGLLRLDQEAIQKDKALQLRFVLQDPSRRTTKVKLRLRIAGQGISIRTSQQFQPKPIIAQYNVPVELSAKELAQYFDPQHLSFAGISKEQVLQNGQLPQGKYRICMEVLDYQSNQLMASSLSESACTEQTLMETDPPVLL